MALKTAVYLSNVTNLSDARYGSGMGVKYLGFPMDGENAVGSYNEIIDWVSGPENVLEFSDSPLEEILAIAKDHQAHHICVKYRDMAIELSEKGHSVIWDNVQDEDLPDTLLTAVIVHNIPVSENTAVSYPVLLARDITAEDLDNILGHPHISGITLYGSDEIRPGYKDYDEIADILEALEVD
jgi:phosphoribosylanthranilate isomerase